MPVFTQSKSSLAWTDYLVIGIRTEFEGKANQSGLTHEVIREYCIVHLKPIVGRLMPVDAPLIYGGNELFETILSRYQLGPRTLVVINNSLVAIGSSDFGSIVDAGSVEIATSELDKYDYGYQESSEGESIWFIVGAPPTIVKLNRPGSNSTITIVDIANYGIKHLETIWDNISPADQKRIDKGSETGWNADHPDVVAKLMVLFLQQYHNVCRTNKLGAVSLTYAGQAMKAFRMRHYDGCIKPHRNEEVAFLEENCYTGGRGEARYFGHYHDKCYLLDIQSLYPSQALEYDFPTELQESKKEPSLDIVKSWLDDSVVFAHVMVETDEAIYPVRQGVSSRFPTGTFNCYLCGEELRECINRGQVIRCYFAARYKKERCLKAYSQAMLDARTVYKTSGSRLCEFIVKYITNGLWGKFGQLGNRWVRDDYVQHDMEYGGFVQLDLDNHKEYQYRVISGRAYKLVRAYWMDNTFVPIAAYANSLSRYLLWRYIQFAGISNVLYCSIDGLIVTEAGKRNLSPFLAENVSSYGKFKISETADSCYIYKYGVYRIGNKVAYMGMPKDNRKRTIGFWNSREDLVANGIDIDHTKVISTVWTNPLEHRLRMGEKDIGNGSFMVPASLEEPPLTNPQYSRQQIDGGLPFVDWLE